MKNEIILLETIQWAATAHADQVRKNSGIPYITHPLDVMMAMTRLSKFDFSLADKQAAILHDVVEDTKFTQRDVVRRFGKEVGDKVKDLTDTSKKTDGTRAVRKKADKERMKSSAVDSKRIKCYDIVCNVTDYLEEDPTYAQKYIKEKILYSTCLKEAGDDYKFLREFLSEVQG